MSVLVKGFEVPKDGCRDCTMVQRGKVFDTCPFLKQEVNGNVERGGRPNGCPLIDIPIGVAIVVHEDGTVSKLVGVRV